MMYYALTVIALFITRNATGCSSAWLERMLGEHEAARSNRAVPIMTEAAKAFVKLRDMALAMSVCVQGDQVRHYHRVGWPDPMPDKFKPGALLNYLDPKERFALGNLTSDEVAKLRVRTDYIIF